MNKSKENNLSTILSIVSVVISLICMIFTCNSNSIYKEELYLTHRPYVFAENYAFINQQSDKLERQPWAIGLNVINSPAKLVKEKYSFFAEKGKESVNISEKEEKVRIIFPDDKMEYNYTLGVNEAFNAEKLIIEGYTVYRNIDIKYCMLFEKKCFTFKSYAKFIPAENRWVFTQSVIAD